MSKIERPSLRFVSQIIESQYIVEDDLVKKCEDLTKDSRIYFTGNPKSRTININQLVLTRARVKGIKAALEIMEKVSIGTHMPRGPIHVKSTGEKFLIIDGNSTVIVLTAIGCKTVEAIVM